jgi:hypothetical protein
LGHLLYSILGLGAYLARSSAGRLGLVAMVITVLGHAPFLPLQGVSTFSAPEEGQAVLAAVEAPVYEALHQPTQRTEHGG